MVIPVFSANSTDPDQTPHSVVSDLVLQSSLFANASFYETLGISRLTLVMLNKLRCHAHF